MKLPDDAIQRLLDCWPVARLASVGPDGRPHQVPIAFARVGECLWSPVDGKPKRGGELARVRNVRARPEVSLLLDDYTQDWARLWWIRVDGAGRVIQPADPECGAACAAAVQALRRKYPQYADLPVLCDPPTLLEVRTMGIQSWCASRAAPTRWSG